MRHHAIQPYVGRQAKGNHIRFESTVSILRAERFARAQRRYMNLMITIDLQKKPKAGMTPYDIFRKRFWANTRARWNTLKAKGLVKGPFDAIAVFENPMTKSEKNTRFWGPYHVHWLVRWPVKHRDKFKRLLGVQYRKEFGFIHRRSINFLDIDASAGVAKYLAKGVDPIYAKHFHVNHKLQGRIDHRRIIVSRSLGPTARKDYKDSGKNPLSRRSLTANKKRLSYQRYINRPSERWVP